MTVPPLVFRIAKGAALTAEEHDGNQQIIRDFCDGLARLFELVFNADGTLKTNSIGSDSIQDRAITQRKLDWLANFYGVATGADNYAVTISPDADFTYGDGIAGAFFCIVKFTNANTGAVTLDVNGEGAKDVKKLTGEGLVAGEIAAGSVHLLVYDGVNFQLLSPPFRVLPAGTPSNILSTISSNTANTANFIPYDNTIPQSGEGEAYADLNATFTAKNVTSKLLIEINLQVSCDANTDFVIALFRDSEADAIAASITSIPATFDHQAGLRTVIDVADILAHTYKVRYGPTSLPATVYINQNSSGAKFGGMLMSMMTITELSQ